MRGTLFAAFLFAALLHGCSREEEKSVSPSHPPPQIQASSPPTATRVTLLDPQDRPLHEVRLANLTDAAFDAQGKIREEAVAASPDRIRVLVEDIVPAGPISVSVSVRPSDPPLVLTLTG